MSQLGMIVFLLNWFSSTPKRGHPRKTGFPRFSFDFLTHGLQWEVKTVEPKFGDKKKHTQSDRHLEEDQA